MNASAPVFPCRALPGDPAQRRFLGLYPQRQEGLWLQRIKLQGGAVSAPQWKDLADMCERFTPGTPLLITTRQDIEFHDITEEAVPGLQQALAEAGFTGLGACGDTLRNITLCPGGGACAGAVDTSPAAEAVRRALMGFPGVFSLPRKFKISFSACEKACGQPCINDLAFVAHRKDGVVRFRVIGAGSLGSRPEAGIVLCESLDPADAPAFALAALTVFHDHGDREKRSRARLRHVRERLGDDAFCGLLLEAFKQCWPIAPRGPAVAPHAKPAFRLAARLTFPCGLITAEQARVIGRTGLTSRIENHHRVALYGADESAGDRVAADPVLGSFTAGHDIVSCPGSRWCKHGIISTHDLELRLRRELPPDFAEPVRISGCPNGCAHSAVAGIGLIGKLRSDAGGERTEGVRVLVGGGMGTTPALAREVEAFVQLGKAGSCILALAGHGAEVQ